MLVNTTLKLAANRVLSVLTERHARVERLIIFNWIDFSAYSQTKTSFYNT